MMPLFYYDSIVACITVMSHEPHGAWYQRHITSHLSIFTSIIPYLEYGMYGIIKLLLWFTYTVYAI